MRVRRSRCSFAPAQCCRRRSGPLTSYARVLCGDKPHARRERHTADGGCRLWRSHVCVQPERAGLVFAHRHTRN
jgi:hypothetical protein